MVKHPHGHVFYRRMAQTYTVTEDQVGVIVETLRQASQALQQTLL